MTQTIRQTRTGWTLLAVVAASGAVWWLVLARPAMVQTFVCGPDGYGPVGGRWHGERLVELGGMWLAMTSAMMLPVAALIVLGCSIRWPHLRRASFPTPPHTWEDPKLWQRRPLVSGGPVPHGFSVIVGEMAGRPDGVLPNKQAMAREAMWPVLFLSGYLSIMAGIGAIAAISQWIMESAGMIGDEGRIANPLLAGALLAGIGALRTSQYWRSGQSTCGSTPETAGPYLSQVWRHGRSSLDGCLTMIGLQLVGGVMNIGLMASLTLWMMADAMLPWRRELGGVGGLALLTAGGLTVAGAVI